MVKKRKTKSKAKKKPGLNDWMVDWSPKPKKEKDKWKF